MVRVTNMPAHIEHYRPNEHLSVREAAFVTGVSTTAINQLIDDGVLPTKVYFRASGKRAIFACGLATVKFNAEASTFLTKRARTSVSKMLLTCFKTQKSLSEALSNPAASTFRSGYLTVELQPIMQEVADRLAKLQAAEEAVEVDPEIREGEPVLKGTRMAVHDIASMVNEHGIDAVLNTYPYLDREKAELAPIYAAAHPKPGRPRRRLPANAHLKTSKRVPLDGQA